jgi:hypothetical protein
MQKAYCTRQNNFLKTQNKAIAMNEKIIALARKLKALADRGIDGERENANDMLTRLMKQHAITLDMIDGIEKAEHEFFIEAEKYKFFKQIAANVLGNGCSIRRYIRDRKKRRSRFIECTASEAIEIQAKFDFFSRVFTEESEIFYRAFIQKNHLYCNPDKTAPEAETEELSAEELAKLWKMSQMMTAMERHHFAKQIAGGQTTGK